MAYAYSEFENGDKMNIRNFSFQMMLDMEVEPTEAEDLDENRVKFCETMIIPEKLAKFYDKFRVINLEELRTFRKEKMKDIMPFVQKQFDKEEVFSNEDLELVTRAILGSILFAGGLSVPNVIYKESS